MRNLFPLAAIIDSCIFPNTRRWLIPIIELAEDGYVLPFWSPTILAESHRLLTWLWLRRHEGDLSAAAWRSCSTAARFMFTETSRVFRVVDDRPPTETLWTENPADEWDVHLWTSAVRAPAQFIVTSNLEDGPPRGSDGIQEYRGIYWIHPDSFLTLVGELIHLGALAAIAKPGELPEALPEFLAVGSRTLGAVPVTVHPSFRRFVASIEQRRFREERSPVERHHPPLQDR